MSDAGGFGGFPEKAASQSTHIYLPNSFFGQLLGQIDSLAELKVTLYCFWKLQRSPEDRFIPLREMQADRALLRGLARRPDDADEALLDALERAAQRGTLLSLEVQAAGGQREALYFLNDGRGKAAFQAIKSGEWQPDLGGLAPIGLYAQQPNAFRLYEQNIGPLTPLIADQLRDLAETYGDAALEEAIQVAVNRNVRHMNYIKAVLERSRERAQPDQADSNDEDDDTWLKKHGDMFKN